MSALTQDTGQAPGIEAPLYGLIGNPVEQSLSPVMHNAAFQALGIHARYLSWPVRNLGGALAEIRASPHIQGFSVTHPFKIRIIPRLDEVDPVASRIGAVNTVVRRGNRLCGYNTDWLGAIDCLQAVAPITGRSHVVLGAGGAARAVLYAIRAQGKGATVVNRGEAAGQRLAYALGVPFVPLSELGRLSGDVLVHATPVGMAPNGADTLVPEALLHRFAGVVDLIYNPPETRLLHEARRCGCITANGLTMMIAQGAEQVRIWTGRVPPVARMRRAVIDALRYTHDPAAPTFYDDGA